MREKVVHHSTSSNAVYGLGFIGAAILYHECGGFLDGCSGRFKSNCVAGRASV